MENGCRFAFHNNIPLTVFDVHFLGFVSEHRAREKEQKNVTLIEHSFGECLLYFSALQNSQNVFKVFILTVTIRSLQVQLSDTRTVTKNCS